MTLKIKDDIKYRLTAIILYFVLNVVSFSLLFLFPPRKLLFNDSKEDKIKQILYKDFAKSIYENINTKLIKNLTLTEDNEECPENLEPLIIKNQYYGNFTKFFGNKTICIERFNDYEYSFINLLKLTDYGLFNDDKKECGTLIKNSNFLVHVQEEIMCPLNHIEIINMNRAKTFGNYYYKLSDDDEYLTPVYGNNPRNPVINNIEIINNYKICLEKQNNAMELPCEFPDNNECFIEDNYEEIFTLQNDGDYKLYPSNLARWNLANDLNINHNFCKDNLRFHIFVKGYMNFTAKNLKEFEDEFPFDDLTNNSLYKTYKIYKSPKNIDRLFYITSFILIFLSSTHFILKIIVYLQKKEIRNIYLIYGVILLSLKLFLYFGMVIYHYYFYLKIEKVYLTLVDKPRNKILRYYSLNRKLFIIKSLTIVIIGFLIITIDFVILVFSYLMKWGIDLSKYIEKINEKNQNSIITENYIKEKEIIKKTVNNFQSLKSTKNSGSKDKTTHNMKSTTFTNNHKIEINPHILDIFDEITLKFICKDNVNKCYIIKADKDESFKNVIKKLREQYTELKQKSMKVFTYESNVISQDKTIDDNQLKDNMIIYVM